MCFLCMVSKDERVTVTIPCIIMRRTRSIIKVLYTVESGYIDLMLYF